MKPSELLGLDADNAVVEGSGEPELTLHHSIIRQGVTVHIILPGGGDGAARADPLSQHYQTGCDCMHYIAR